MPSLVKASKYKQNQHAVQPVWLRNTLICGALFIFTFVAFIPALRCGFFDLDDLSYVAHNHHVRDGLTVEGWTWAWTTLHEANWHPLTWLSLQMDATLFGDGATGFHVTNILLHATNTVLLFLVFYVFTGASWRIAPAVALWAVHPLRVESVVWITERKDVLSTFFGLLALLAYGYYVRRPSVYRYLAIVIALILSLLSKPMLVTFPFLLLVLDWWPLGRFSGGPPPAIGGPKQSIPLWRLLAEKGPLLALVIASSVVTLYAQKIGGAVRSLEEFALTDRLNNVLVTYAIYLFKNLWPFDLVILYPMPNNGWTASQVLMSAVVLLVLTGYAVSMYRRKPYFLMGWLWYLGTLVPVVGLVQVGVQAYADRYTYFPLIGIFVALTWWLSEPGFRSFRTLVAGGAGVIFAGLIALTWLQINHYWVDSIAMWKHTIEITGDNIDAYTDLLFSLNDKEKWDEYLETAKKALHLWPQNPRLLTEYANSLLNFNRTEEALPILEKLLRADPDDSKIHLYIGRALGNRLRFEEALVHFRAGLVKGSNDPKVYVFSSRALRLTGHLQEALQNVHEAFLLAPKDPEVCCEMGLVLEELGNLDEALAFARKAVELKPDRIIYNVYLAAALSRRGRESELQELLHKMFHRDPHWPEGVDELAWTLATAGDSPQHNGRVAVELSRLVCRVSEYRQARFLDTLATAYADSGRFSEAQETERKAVALFSSAGQNGKAQEVEARLHLFEQEKTYRGDRSPPGP